VKFVKGSRTGRVVVVEWVWLQNDAFSVLFKDGKGLI